MFHCRKENQKATAENWQLPNSLSYFPTVAYRNELE
jgi:hypothetical protein